MAQPPSYTGLIQNKAKHLKANWSQTNRWDQFISAGPTARPQNVCAIDILNDPPGGHSFLKQNGI